MVIDKASPLFEVLGGMHNVHVNSVGESALRKGGPYPNGTVFLTDLHEFSVVDGSYVEGALKGLAVMAKDSKKYASTGGWGFQFWTGGDPKKPIVTDAANNASNVINQKGSGLCLFYLHSLIRLVLRSPAFRPRTWQAGVSVPTVGPLFHRTWRPIETWRLTHGWDA
jgi:hypothetical protein